MSWLRSSVHGLTLLASVAALTSCQQLQQLADGDKQKPFPVLIRVESDPQKPLADIPILYQGKEVRRTGPDGSALLELHKPDGSNVELTITCPPGTKPAEPLKVFVRRVEGQGFIEQRMACKPSMRHIAVAVRADEGPNVLVTYLGTTMATTDASGAAHFVLNMPPGEPVKVALDASAYPKMHPQRAEALFKVADADDVFVFDQKFTTDKKPVRGVYKKSGPTPLRH